MGKTCFGLQKSGTIFYPISPLSVMIYWNYVDFGITTILIVQNTTLTAYVIY
jgi:hypothetical protein